jgi:hypothetical protein
MGLHGFVKILAKILALQIHPYLYPGGHKATDPT